MIQQKNKLKVGVVGATGMVGQAFMSLLAERNFPVAELRPFASENSLGKKINLQGQDWDVQVLKPGCFAGLDLVFFSSGDDISAEWAPQAVAAGAFAVPQLQCSGRVESHGNRLYPVFGFVRGGAGRIYPKLFAGTCLQGDGCAAGFQRCVLRLAGIPHLGMERTKIIKNCRLQLGANRRPAAAFCLLRNLYRQKILL